MAREKPGSLREVFRALPTLFFWSRRFRHSVFLIHRLSGLDDIICTLPSVATLKHRRPKAIVLYETQRAYMTLLKSCPHVDMPLEKGSLLAEVVRRFLKPQMLYPFLPDEKKPPQPRKRIHLVDEFRKELGFNSLTEQCARLNIPAKALRTVRERLKHERIGPKRFLVIHPGPSWKVKEWPEEKWASLVAKLRSLDGVEVIQVGEDQTVDGRTIPTARIAGTRDWVGKLTLDQTLALLNLARLFVGIDSGLLHLAGAAGTPCVSIFGPTAPECFLPRTGRAVGVTSDVPCLGCHHHPEGPLHWQDGCPYDLRCMKELSVDIVFASCQSLLETPQPTH